MSKSCRHASVAWISGRAAATIPAGRNRAHWRWNRDIYRPNRERNRERVRFRHNCPNPPFGRETHVDGAWLDPGAFGRATRDLFPRSNDTGRESIGMAPRVRLGRRADNAQDGSQCPVSTSSGHCAMAGGTSQLRQAGLHASPSRRTAVRPKWADRRLGSPRFLNAINRRSRRRYHARAPPNGEYSSMMIGRWKLGAQLSTSHSSRGSLDPFRMLETVRRVQDAIDLDLLIVGFREAARNLPRVLWFPPAGR